MQALPRLHTIKEEDLFPQDHLDTQHTPWLTWGVLHPEGWFHIVWDLTLMSLLIHQAFYVPYQICLSVPVDSATQQFDVIVNVVFMTDILVSLNTGVLEKGSLVMSRVRIARSYLRFWFWLDILASFPYDWVINGGPLIVPHEDSNQATKVPRLLRILKMVRFFRMLRLLRLAKLRKLMMQIEEVISNSFIVTAFLLIKLLVVVFFIAHLTGSFWYYVSASESLEHPVTWITTFEVQSRRTLDYEDFYIAALYWAFTTMATVGYGDFVPYTAIERLYAILCMIVACGMFAYTVGSIGNIVAKQSQASTEQRETVLRTNAYMRKGNLPRELQFRIRRYLDFKWDAEEDHFMDEESVLSMLSDPLRNEVSAFIHGDIIKTCPTILGFTDSFVQQLTKTFRSVIFAPGDSIIEEGQLSFELYFIQSGIVDVFHRGSNTTFQELNKGSYFGEIGFFTGHTRWASVRCLLFTSLLSLRIEELKELVKKNPEAEDYLEGVRERCKDGNYSSLEVNCYLCAKKGHVALRCEMAIVNLDNAVTKKKWLQNKLVRKTVRVNPYFNEPPDFTRTQKKQVRAFGKASKYTDKRATLFSQISSFFRRDASVTPTLSEVKPAHCRGNYNDYDSEEETPAVRAPVAKSFSKSADETFDQSAYGQYEPPNSPMSLLSDSELKQHF
jgi:hyperpolarization activated cyclic nucleotide-gated potassium channel 2